MSASPGPVGIIPAGRRRHEQHAIYRAQDIPPGWWWRPDYGWPWQQRSDSWREFSTKRFETVVTARSYVEAKPAPPPKVAVMLDRDVVERRAASEDAWDDTWAVARACLEALEREDERDG